MPTQAPGPALPTSGRTPEGRGTTILQSAERRPQRQKFRQKSDDREIITFLAHLSKLQQSDQK